jgi:uncharacterized membrane protein YgcG
VNHTPGRTPPWPAREWSAGTVERSCHVLFWMFMGVWCVLALWRRPGPRNGVPDGAGKVLRWLLVPTPPLAEPRGRDDAVGVLGSYRCVDVTADAGRNDAERPQFDDGKFKVFAEVVGVRQPDHADRLCSANSAASMSARATSSRTESGSQGRSKGGSSGGGGASGCSATHGSLRDRRHCVSPSLGGRERRPCYRSGRES